MRITFKVFALLLLCSSVVNSQERDSSHFVVGDYLVETKTALYDNVEDLGRIWGSLKLNELEDIPNFMAARNVYFWAAMSHLAISNCVFIWSTTMNWSDTNTFDPAMTCEGINYNINFIELCADEIQRELSGINEPKILIIQGNDTKQYLRDFVSKFKKLSVSYLPYATVCD